MKRDRGFTLIELLVVIAIIAILAAILFPVFLRAQDSARQSACHSNMKQIALGQMQYLQDWNDTFEPGFGSLVKNPNKFDLKTSWASVLHPYIKNVGVWYCPSAPYRGEKYWGSYCANSYCIRDPRFFGQYAFGDSYPKFTSYLKVSRIPRPVKVALMWEESRYVQNSSGWRMCDYQFGLYWSSGTPINQGRHGGGDNLIFCDGHVRYYSMKCVVENPETYIFYYPPGSTEQNAAFWTKTPL